MRRFFAHPIAMRELLSLTKPDRLRRRALGRGRKRVHAILSREQVLAILELRERRGWSALRISRHLHLSQASVTGVVECGNGTRTVLINGGGK